MDNLTMHRAVTVETAMRGNCAGRVVHQNRLLSIPISEDTTASGIWIGFWISWLLVFLGSWAYCISEYGYLLGVGLGWLPSAIVASVVALWPASLIAVAVIVAYVMKH